jgi:hypothetical protein
MPEILFIPRKGRKDAKASKCRAEEENGFAHSLPRHVRVRDVFHFIRFLLPCTADRVPDRGGPHPQLPRRLSQGPHLLHQVPLRVLDHEAVLVGLVTPPATTSEIGGGFFLVLPGFQWVAGSRSSPPKWKSMIVRNLFLLRNPQAAFQRVSIWELMPSVVALVSRFVK